MSITDTTKTPRPEWVLGGNPGAIERQEAQGQQELAASSQLPREGLGEAHTKEFGIKVLGTSQDPLFEDVRLPEGWKIQPTSHSMWSDLLDASGVKRAAIFYKAAFYDRNATIYWEAAK